MDGGPRVQVVNLSLRYAPDGPGDGTSPYSDSPLNTIDFAVSQGITWVTAGGNSVRRTWYGALSDPDGDGMHNWTPEDKGNDFIINEGEIGVIFMRWEDMWGSADCDLDLEFYSSTLGPDVFYPLISSDRTSQDGNAGSVPFAVVNAQNISVTNGRVEYTIRRLSPGARHAFTVLTSNNFLDTVSGGSVSSEFFWPSNPRWTFLPGREGSSVASRCHPSN